MNFVALVNELMSILGITADNFILYFAFQCASALFMVLLLALLFCFPVILVSRWLDR